MITKDCPTALERCLKSVIGVLAPDDITILDTGSSPRNRKEYERLSKEIPFRYFYENLQVDVADRVKEWLPEWVEVFEKSSLVHGQILDFAGARAKCSELAKYPVQLWIDSDDTIVEQQPGQLRWVINKLFGTQGINGRKADSLFLEYLYAFDKSDGSCITTLKRERIVDYSRYRWVGRCHETLIPREEKHAEILGAAFFQDVTTAIRHHKDQGDSRPTDIRNYVILRTELEESKAEGKPIDPRTVFYLGNACRGLSRDAEAIEHYDYLYRHSGSLEDRYLALYYTAMIWLNDRSRRPLDAIDTLFKALRLKPLDPRTHYALARSYYALGRYPESIHWFKQGRTLQLPPDMLHATDPQHTELLPFQIAALCYKEMNRPDDARACVNEMQRRYPKHQLTKGVTAVIDSWFAEAGLVDSVMRLVANEIGPDRPRVPAEVKERVLRHLERLPHIPPSLEKQGFARPEPEAESDPKEVVFYCGQSIEPFGPKTTGLGGSEKMVCLMAPRLARLGYTVRVYGEVPEDQRGVDKDGVFWWHWGGMDLYRKRGTVIFWRMPEMLELPIPAEKRIVWCHDVQDPRRWTDVRIALADQVWVLSEYHATTLGAAREKLGSKVRITRNAVDTDAYSGPAPERDPAKIIFASSPDRGVGTAIRLFKEAKPQLPEGAKLHIYYGFNKVFLRANAQSEHRYIPDLDRDANGWEYMQFIHHEVDQDDDIVWHGRKSWDEMVTEQRTAGVWLYPTRFPEISCMAAMEAQCAGCHVVASDFAALGETVDWTVLGNFKIDPKKPTVDRLVWAVGHDGDREKAAAAALKRFSADILAEEWRALIDG